MYYEGGWRGELIEKMYYTFSLLIPPTHPHNFKRNEMMEIAIIYIKNIKMKRVKFSKIK
jgi:hypothetical protein